MAAVLGSNAVICGKWDVTSKPVVNTFENDQRTFERPCLPWSSASLSGTCKSSLNVDKDCKSCLFGKKLEKRKNVRTRRKLSSLTEATAEVGEKESSIDSRAARTLRALEEAVVNGKPQSGLTVDCSSTDARTASHEGCNGSATSSGDCHDQGITQFLRGKNVLITGATGFLAKVLVEKVLREQPDVGHIYLIIQEKADVSANQRLERQVIGSQVFDLLRETHVAEYGKFMLSKLTAVEGNISQEGLGLSTTVAEELMAKVDIMIHSAASTTFDERYDVALNVNTFGALRAAQFAEGCKNLQVLLHVSTAFVNGRRIGRTAEQPFSLGDSIAKELQGGENVPKLDVEEELALMNKELRAAEAEAEAAAMSPEKRQAYIQRRMVAVGLERAHLFGWQDTYVFTKAMGEMLISRYRHTLPIAVVRPSIVESSLSEPLLGWMEGIRMADPIFLAYGKGQVEGFPADRNGALDMVPVDMVVNAMLAMLVKHAKTNGLTIYHVATSVVNPLTNGKLAEAISEHFSLSPMFGKDGRPIRVEPLKVYGALYSFQAHMWFKYQLPLQAEKLLTSLQKSTVSSSLSRKRNNIMLKTFEQLSYLAKLYQPYTFYACRFDATNTLKLFAELSPKEQELFNFDLSKIDWRDYVVRVHIPGLRKFVLKGRGSQ